jgi:hypothetical protein
VNWRSQAAAVTGAVGDAARTAFAFVYWNARKGAYVRRGRQGRCPCQNPSDDSIPGHVRCNAVLLWHSPARFHRVCPLLVRAENGWCCAVNAQGVRPFWGRAAAWYGGTLVALYVAAVLTVTVFLRFASGVPVAPWDIAWPGRWSHVRSAQADQLYQRGLQAMAAGRPREALLALSSARQRAPDHLPAGLMLAQITMYQGSAAFSDSMFEELLRQHPAEAQRIAVVYHDTLLSLDRLDRLAEFSLGRALADDGRTALWVQSLLAALRAGPDATEFLTRHIAEVRRLAPHAQVLLEAERAVAERNLGAAIFRLREPFKGALNPTYMREQIERLAQLGSPQDAQVLLDFYGPLLGAFEHQLTQFALDSINHDTWGARASLRRLLREPLGPDQIQRLATRLAQYPSAERFRECHAVLSERSEVAKMPVAAALWVAALRCGAPREAAFWRSQAQTHGEGNVPDVRQIDSTSRDPNNPASLAFIANVLTLPREMVLALIPSRPATTPGLRLLP